MDKKYECPKCGKQYKTEGWLKRHVCPKDTSNPPSLQKSSERSTEEEKKTVSNDKEKKEKTEVSSTEPSHEPSASEEPLKEKEISEQVKDENEEWVKAEGRSSFEGDSPIKEESYDFRDMVMSIIFMMTILIPADFFVQKHFIGIGGSLRFLLYPIQFIVTYLTGAIQMLFGLPVIIKGPTTLYYTDLRTNFEVAPVCTGFREMVFLSTLILLTRNVSVDVRFRWTGYLAFFVFMENIIRIIVLYPVAKTYGIFAMDRFHIFWFRYGQLAFVMSVYGIWAVSAIRRESGMDNVGDLSKMWVSFESTKEYVKAALEKTVIGRIPRNVREGISHVLAVFMGNGTLEQTYYLLLSSFFTSFLLADVSFYMGQTYSPYLSIMWLLFVAAGWFAAAGLFSLSALCFIHLYFPTRYSEIRVLLQLSGYMLPVGLPYAALMILQRKVGKLPEPHS